MFSKNAQFRSTYLAFRLTAVSCGARVAGFILMTKPSKHVQKAISKAKRYLEQRKAASHGLKSFSLNQVMATYNHRRWAAITPPAQVAKLSKPLNNNDTSPILS